LIRLLLLCLLLAGCATNPQPGQRPPATEISTFAFTGRIAVRQGETRHYVNIDWHHATGSDEILLNTPLGQGLAELTRNATGARLLLADQRHYEAQDWGTLSAEVFGFRLPLAASARWLLGEVANTEGWRVTVVERESTASHALPTIIELERDDIFVRLKIDEWSEVK
jgi:outer membrane lipoprotein LolB